VSPAGPSLMISSALPLLTTRETLAARRFIEAQGLTFEEAYDDLVGVFEGESIVATGARAGFVLKMLAIDPGRQGGGLLGLLVAELMRLGRAAGHEVFWVFTRPASAPSFEQLNFRLLVVDGSVALLEFGGGLERYLAAHQSLRRPGRNAAVVANANPFTLGHLFLIESAARAADTLYLFIVREDRSVFPFEVRCRLAVECTRHLPNVVVLDTSRYAVSAGTFPSYFLKCDDEVARAQMRVDARLFGQRLAPPFSIVRRVVGHEPYCPATASYNQAMKDVLPEHGVELVEIQRAGDATGFISATRVRERLAAGDLSAVRSTVPPPTLAFLESPAGVDICERLRRRGDEGLVPTV
jgi:[citrate (pro-3S)-lyase] ligase